MLKRVCEQVVRTPPLSNRGIGLTLWCPPPRLRWYLGLRSVYCCQVLSGLEGLLTPLFIMEEPVLLAYKSNYQARSFLHRHLASSQQRL